MKIKYLGEVVRDQRKLLHIRQEPVCEGICTIMTLSRFESGRQTPSRDCVIAILQRLGLPDDRYYAQLTKEETQLVRLKTEILAYCSQFEQTIGEEQQQARMSALKELLELEHCIKENDRINQQFVLGMKATLGTYPPKKKLEMLMDAIRLTSPRFDPDDLKKCLYCANELIIINKIAIYYDKCGQRSKAIDIYEQLLDLLLKRTPDHKYLHLITYNYAQYLALEDRFEEALGAVKIGRQLCVERESYCLLPSFLHIEAKCHHLMSEANRSAELYRSAYHIYGAIMDTKHQKTLKNDVKNCFDLSF